MAQSKNSNRNIRMYIKILYIFKKIQGSTPSGYVARSVRVDRRTVKRKSSAFKKTKLASGLSQHHFGYFEYSYKVDRAVPI